LPPSPAFPLIVVAAFVAGLFVITRLERWADIVGGVLGVVAVCLLGALLLALTPPAPSAAGGVPRQTASRDPMTGLDVTGSVRR
jgi:hypothetical protein